MSMLSPGRNTVLVQVGRQRKEREVGKLKTESVSLFPQYLTLKCGKSFDAEQECFS